MVPMAEAWSVVSSIHQNQYVGSKGIPCQSANPTTNTKSARYFPSSLNGLLFANSDASATKAQVKVE